MADTQPAPGTARERAREAALALGLQHATDAYADNIVDVADEVSDVWEPIVRDLLKVCDTADPYWTSEHTDAIAQAKAALGA